MYLKNAIPWEEEVSLSRCHCDHTYVVYPAQIFADVNPQGSEAVDSLLLLFPPCGWGLPPFPAGNSLGSSWLVGVALWYETLNCRRWIAKALKRFPGPGGRGACSVQCKCYILWSGLACRRTGVDLVWGAGRMQCEPWLSAQAIVMCRQLALGFFGIGMIVVFLKHTGTTERKG